VVLLLAELVQVLRSQWPCKGLGLLIQCGSEIVWYRVRSCCTAV
jgi:hypothetical protein